MKRIYKLIGLLIVIALIAVGCTSKVTDTSQSEDQETNQSEEEVGQDMYLDKQEEEKEEEKQNENEDSTGEVKSKVLLDMMNAKEYTTEIKMITKSGQNESEALTTTVVSGDKVYSSTESGAMTMKFIEKEDKSYLIMDDTKTIIVSNRYTETDGEIDFVSRNLVYDDLEYVGKGTEEFLGNQMPYEEYNIELGSVKYYIDGNKLDGMEVLIDMEKLLGDEIDDEEFAGMVDEESSIKMKILSYEKEADSSLFELPEEYELVGQ